MQVSVILETDLCVLLHRLVCVVYGTIKVIWIRYSVCNRMNNFSTLCDTKSSRYATREIFWNVRQSLRLPSACTKCYVQRWTVSWSIRFDLKLLENFPSCSSTTEFPVLPIFTCAVYVFDFGKVLELANIFMITCLHRRLIRLITTCSGEFCCDWHLAVLPLRVTSKSVSTEPTTHHLRQNGKRFL